MLLVQEFSPEPRLIIVVVVETDFCCVNIDGFELILHSLIGLGLLIIFLSQALKH